MPEVQSPPNPLARFLGWLNWNRIIACSVALALAVGLLNYALVPRTFTAVTSLLFASQSGVSDALQSLAASGGGAMGAASSLSQLGVTATPDQWLGEVARSRKIRQAVAKTAALPQKLACSEPESLTWLTEVTNIKGMQKGLSLSGSVGMLITVTIPGPNRLQQILRLRTPLSAPDAQKLCAELANGYVTALDEYLTSSGVSSARQTRKFVEQRSAKIRKQLDATEDDLEALQIQYRLVDPASQASRLITDISALNQARAAAAKEVKNAQGALAAARRLLPHEEAMRIQQEVTIRHPLIGQLEGKLLEQRNQLSTALAAGKSAEHPDVVAIQATISDSEEQLRRISREIRAQFTRQPNPAREALWGKVIELEVELAGARAAASEAGSDLAAIEKQVTALPPVARRFMELSRQRDVLADLLVTLAKRLEIAAIQEQQETNGRFEQLDPAVVPPAANGSGTVRKMIMSFILAVVVLGLAWGYRRGLFADPVDLS